MLGFATLGKGGTTPVKRVASPVVTVFFSPKGGGMTEVVSQINKAKSIIRVQAYTFTSLPVYTALGEAKKRGVDVQVIVDREYAAQSWKAVSFLMAAGIPVFADSKHPIAHNKSMVIDNRVTITGSYNFTMQAENNAENILSIKHVPTAVRYMTNWQEHHAHTTQVTVPPTQPGPRLFRLFKKPPHE